MAALSSFAETQPQLVERLCLGLAGPRLHHAFLFVGATATPLAALAKAFAHSLRCRDRLACGSACGSCTTCRGLAGGHPSDFWHLEADERGTISIGVIRRLAQHLSLRAQAGRHRVALICAAQHMPAAAQNALLKILEEPPPHTTFVLSAPSTGGLLPTVRSRCTVLHLVAPAHHEAAAHLAAGGIALHLAALLAPAVGSDVEAAQALLDAGAQEAAGLLQRAWREGLTTQHIVAAASDWGQDPARTHVALTLLEVLVRDGLAHAHGVDDAMLYHPIHAHPTTDRLAAATGVLRRLRRLGAIHYNRQMALETLLFALFGAGL